MPLGMTACARSRRDWSVLFFRATGCSYSNNHYRTLAIRAVKLRAVDQARRLTDAQAVAARAPKSVNPPNPSFTYCKALNLMFQ
jgi:hypothetical protein